MTIIPIKTPVTVTEVHAKPAAEPNKAPAGVSHINSLHPTSPLSTTAPIIPVAPVKRTLTEHIVWHVTATPEGREFNAKDIDRMHRQEGWQCIGYHYIIKLDGTVESGRPEDIVGAHVLNFNHNTIGISCVGGVTNDGKITPKDTRTPAQIATQIALTKDILTRYPHATVAGHRDFPHQNRACPCFDAIPYAKAHGLPAGFAAGQPR